MIPQITWAAKTDIGHVRRENQDRWLARHDDGLFAVADGMGGMPYGGEAAAEAIAALEEFFVSMPPAHAGAWRDLALRVNERVRRRGMLISPGEGIGTTLTLLHLNPGGGTLAHIGDSACFLSRDGVLSQLTEDHTVEAEAIRSIAKGMRVELQPWAGHILTRCLGQAQMGSVDVSSLNVEPGDRLLLCTDGITKVLDKGTIAHQLTKAATPDDAVRGMVDAALSAGGPDNATGIAIFVAAQAA